MNDYLERAPERFTTQRHVAHFEKAETGDQKDIMIVKMETIVFFA